MDIQKERDEFEAWLFSTEKFKFRNKIFLFMLDEYGNYEDEPVLRHWETWQAAKAQAVPEGFVLVPKEPNKQFKNVLSHYLDELWMGEWGCDWDGFICVNGIDPNEIWQFMIETQEQIDDGEVV